MDGTKEVKIHSPKGPIGEFVARGCQIWLTLMYKPRAKNISLNVVK